MANPNVGYSAMALSATIRSTTIPEPIRPISKAVGVSTTILDPIRAISEAVGAINKEEITYQAPSRSGIPKKRRGRLKQQSMVDPAVLLATPRSYWLESSTTGQIEPEIEGTDCGEED